MADIEHIAIGDEHFAHWSILVRVGDLTDYGLTLDDAASATPREDGRKLYAFPREHLDAVLVDYMASMPPADPT